MSLTRSLIIYTGSSVLASALPLALLPVMTHHLTDSEYGIVATMTTLIAFFTPPLIWGTTAIASIEYHKLSADEFKRFVGSILAIPLVSFVVLSMLAAASAPWLAPRLGIPPLWFAAVPLMAAMGVLPQLFSAILRMKNAAMTYGAFEFTTALLTVLLSLGLVVGLQMHWQGRVYAYAFTAALTTLIAGAWLFCQGYLKLTVDRAYLKEALKFGAGLLPHDFGNQAIRLADRLFLVAMVGLASAGQYAVAAQVTSVVMVLLSAFNRAWAPYLFPRLRNATPSTQQDIVRKSYGVIAAFLLFFIGFNAIVPYAYHLFVDPKFHPSMAFVPWLTMGYFFTAVYMTYIDYIFYVKKTHVLSVITMINMTLNLTLNYLLIGQFGSIGSAYAFAATMFIVMVLAFILSNALHPMPWFYWLRKAT